MFSSRARHILLQKLFWNRPGAWVVPKIMRLMRVFDTVVRGYSLLGYSNGEDWLVEQVDPDPVMVDVGFYAGDSTAAFLAACPGAKVHAFDPSRFGARNYKDRFADEDRVRFNAAALASAPGELEFYDYQTMSNSLAPRKESPGTEPEVYKVPVLTLDGYAHEARLDRIHFLKIDAEGFDLDVLEGAQALLSAQKVDLFMFEFASAWAGNKRSLWEAVEYLEPLPYRLFRLFNGFLVPVRYRIEMDSCTTLPAMYVGVSEARLERGDIPIRDYSRF